VNHRPTAAIVIPAWNSLDYLPACLESLSGQSADHELLVVDNGSVDGSVAWLREHGVPHLGLERNTGFAAAVNLGVRSTSAEAILVLNADTVLEPDCLTRLLHALDAAPELGGVQPQIVQLGTATPRLYSAGQCLSRDGRAFEQGAGEPPGIEARSAREVFGVCGAACLLRRRLFTELGGYDERYFAFYEDVDLNVRARIAGWRFLYAPQAVVGHAGHASWQQGFERPGPDNARFVGRNRLATQIKFMPWTAIPRIGVVESGSLLRALRQRRFLATARGKLAALRWLPALLSERRRLRYSGRPELARSWLGSCPSARNR
jgi:GT2 family glycosyltransferase